jgi:AraC-like DNA-binding protein
MSAGTEQADEATAAANQFRVRDLVPARNAALVVAAYDALGEDADAALRCLGSSRERISAPDALVPAALTFQLLALANARDPTFSVRAGARLPWGHAGLIDYVNGSRATLGAVLESMVRFVRVVTSNSQYALEDEASGVLLRASYAHAPPPPLARMLSEFTTSLMFGRLREITGRDVGVEVRFQHAAPSWEPALRERFGCRVAFDSPKAGILLTRESLAYPSRRADARLEAIVERHALDVLRADPASDTLTDSVGAAIRIALPDGLPTLRRVAKALATSERTLRRRLAGEGIAFGALRERELQRLARDLLCSRSSTVDEVAYLLGFSEARAFQRAFKRWTGETPGAYRARATRAPRSSS